jgi:hypothetical protein
VTVKDEYVSDWRKSGFSVLFGVATVYRPKIDLAMPPRNNSNWLYPLYMLYVRENQLDYDKKTCQKLFEFAYFKDNSKDLTRELTRALGATREYALPQFNRIVDLDTCLDYLEMMGLYTGIYEYEYGFNKWIDDYYEGLTYIKLNAREKYIYKKEHGYEQQVVSYISAKKEGDIGYSEKLEEMQKDIISKKPERLKRYNKIFDDLEWCEKARIELERRKAANTEILRSYGLDI